GTMIGPSNRGRMTARAAAIGLALAIAAVPTLSGQSPGGEATREAEYALSIAQVADSAIHRLDFFPARFQLRAQMLFLGRADSAAVVFAALSARSMAAAVAVDDVSSDFERTLVPGDLGELHHELVGALHAARGSLDRLSRSANACAADASSLSRCQSPFAAASIALGQAYAHYLEARQRIANQIADTKTVLPAFVTASVRGARAAPPAGASEPSDDTPVAFRQEPAYVLSELDRRDHDARPGGRP
ncbi:MAG: hypothetical protein ACHQWU_11920, partial [Gemmatimonadales bacterium]